MYRGGPWQRWALLACAGDQPRAEHASGTHQPDGWASNGLTGIAVLLAWPLAGLWGKGADEAGAYGMAFYIGIRVVACFRTRTGTRCTHLKKRVRGLLHTEVGGGGSKHRV